MVAVSPITIHRIQNIDLSSLSEVLMRDDKTGKFACFLIENGGEEIRILLGTDFSFESEEKASWKLSSVLKTVFGQKDMFGGRIKGKGGNNAQKKTMKEAVKFYEGRIFSIGWGEIQERIEVLKVESRIVNGVFDPDFVVLAPGGEMKCKAEDLLPER